MKNLFLQYNTYSKDYMLSEGSALEKSQGNWVSYMNPAREILDRIDTKRNSCLYLSSDIPLEVISELERTLKNTKVKIGRI